MVPDAHCEGSVNDWDHSWFEVEARVHVCLVCTKERAMAQVVTVEVKGGYL